MIPYMSDRVLPDCATVLAKPRSLAAQSERLYEIISYYCLLKLRFQRPVPTDPPRNNKRHRRCEI